jgi:dolichol-phosphate mannosyltransferase
MELSIVIPVRNEAANIAPLVREIGAALGGHVEYEIVYVDDGSSDGTEAAVRAVGSARLVRHRRSYGQSAAIRTGVKAARAPWIATLDGDGQNDPADIPRLFDIARAAPRDPPMLVAGLRAKRRDSTAKRWASRIANSVRARLLGDATLDTGCGLKIIRREVYLELPFFDHNHRFLPALMMRHGGRTISVPVNHRPRERGQSNYGVLDRLWVGIVDLCGVMWLKRRGSRPELLPEPERAEEPRAAKSATPVS